MNTKTLAPGEKRITAVDANPTSWAAINAINNAAKLSADERQALIDENEMLHAAQRGQPLQPSAKKPTASSSCHASKR